jgi:hypothetical protein
MHRQCSSPAAPHGSFAVLKACCDVFGDISAASNGDARRSDTSQNFWRTCGKLAHDPHVHAPLVYTATRSATACSPHLASRFHVSVLQEQ